MGKQKNDRYTGSNPRPGAAPAGAKKPTNKPMTSIPPYPGKKKGK